MKRIIYLDAAATYLKSEKMIKRQADFLRNEYANSGRGLCARVANVDGVIRATRDLVAKFINCDSENVVFTFGTTDGINRILNILRATKVMFGKNTVCCGSDLDHHSLRGPFENSECKFVVCPLDKELNIDCKKIPYCDVFLITAMSNVLGMPQDVEKIIKYARKKNPNVITIVDCAQYVVHNAIDVKKWNCDFMCFSGHKIGADTGLGVMYIKNPERFNTDKFGGGMVKRIVDNRWILEQEPNRFEAGTLPITQIVGLSVAIAELKKHRPDLKLVKFMYNELSKNKKIHIVSKPNSSVLSFVIDNMHVLDFGALIAQYNICVRVGNMCASWIHRHLGVDGTIRISVGAWNTMRDIKYAIKVINKIIK